MGFIQSRRPGLLVTVEIGHGGGQPIAAAGADEGYDVGVLRRPHAIAAWATLMPLVSETVRSASRQGEVLVDAQDWEISAFDIAVSDVPPDKAIATVSFKNTDTPMKVVLNLVKVNNS